MATTIDVLSQMSAEDIIRNRDQPGFMTLIASCTGAEMFQLMHSMRDPKARAVLTAALLSEPKPAPAPVLPVIDRAVVPEKAKKALNAFVGFRCYYLGIPAFAGTPMKKLSQPLGMLWENDPNKSKWSLLAKAWSMMRDQLGKDKVPLEAFFALACPYLNVPPPHAYLFQTGWIAIPGQDGSMNVEKDPFFTAQFAVSGVVDKARSVEDIIRYVQAQGYAPDFICRADSTLATFIGHSNAIRSKTTITRETAWSAEAARKQAAERMVRQAKRQIAQERGLYRQLMSEIEGNKKLVRAQDTTADADSDHGVQQPRYQGPTETELNIADGCDVYKIIFPTSVDMDYQTENPDDKLYLEMHAMATRTASSLSSMLQQPLYTDSPSQPFDLYQCNDQAELETQAILTSDLAVEAGYGQPASVDGFP